jgi:hypothetical protein
VDSWRDQVRWVFVSELHDPLTEVSFDDVDASGLQGVVQPHFLGHHRLALDSQLRSPVGRELRDDPASVFSGTGDVDDGPDCFSFAGKLLDKLGKPVDGVCLEVADTAAHGGKVLIGEGVETPASELWQRSIERSRKGFVRYFRRDEPLEGFPVWTLFACLRRPC